MTIRTTLTLTIATLLICFLKHNAVGETSIVDKNLSEVFEETRSLYGKEGSAVSTLIHGLSDYIHKSDPDNSEEVKTNVNDPRLKSWACKEQAS